MEELQEQEQKTNKQEFLNSIESINKKKLTYEERQLDFEQSLLGNIDQQTAKVIPDNYQSYALTEEKIEGIGYKSKYEKVTRRIERRKKRFIKQLAKCNGSVSMACVQANISRTAIKNWMKLDEAFEQEIIDIQEMITDTDTDIARNGLRENLLSGNMKAIELQLNAHGQALGYGKAKDTGAGDGGILNIFTQVTNQTLNTVSAPGLIPDGQQEVIQQEETNKGGIFNLLDRGDE